MSVYTYETMRKIITPYGDIRLWIAGCQYQDKYLNELETGVTKAFNVHNNACLPFHNIAEEIMYEFSELNAIEIVNRFGNGVVVYRDWP